MKISRKRIIPFALLSLMLGCEAQISKTETASDDEKEHAHADDDHSHGDGPHGGAIVDWGGGAYHVEFTVDHDKKEVTLYILGSDEKSPAPVKADKVMLTIDDPLTEIDLAAMPLDGESGGKSSRFVAKHDTLGIVRDFAGAIIGEIEGTPYYGEFKEGAHEEHHH